jgi:hypothetical protein
MKMALGVAWRAHADDLGRIDLDNLILRAGQSHQMNDEQLRQQ